jgi:Ca-activated chloride channel family protein
MDTRRPVLVVAGLSLLATGIWLNASRLGLRSDVPIVVNEQHVDAERYLTPPEPVDEEVGGEGHRHKGEEGKMGHATRKVTVRYAAVAPNPVVAAENDARSTFSIDVDTASYANTRRFLVQDGERPPVNSVRTEELVNYFDYEYPAPRDDLPFSVTTEVGPTPWNPESRLVHIGMRGKVLGDGEVPKRNLVFLVDVSGSMAGPDRLPLVKYGLATLTQQLADHDRVALVVYAGAAGLVLPPTRGDEKDTILAALDRLDSGGSTNGAAGIHLAYALAREHFVEGGINRVILATDGDFNVGASSDEELLALIEEKRESGVFLSVLGVGTTNLNDSMMEKVADAGNGNYAYIDGPLEAQKVLVEEASATLDTIAKDVKIQVEFDPRQVKSHRLVGYDNRVLEHADFIDDDKDAGEMGAGHSVTALYEIVPAERSANDPLMTLRVRWKDPDARTSQELELGVLDDDRDLDETSDDFRFAAAVVMFAENLRFMQESEWSDVLELASEAVGDDPHCYRHEFLDLVWRAARASGTDLERPDPDACAPKVMTAVPMHRDLWAFVLEVLRLLPPLLALPLFVLAFRKRAA